MKLTEIKREVAKYAAANAYHLENVFDRSEWPTETFGNVTCWVLRDDKQPSTGDSDTVQYVLSHKRFKGILLATVVLTPITKQVIPGLFQGDYRISDIKLSTE